MKKIGLIFGGNSPEHFVSCKSACTILEHINHKKYKVIKIGVTHQNRWYEWDGCLEELRDGTWYHEGLQEIENHVSFLKQFDLIFPIIHGNNGEDGRLQGMLELFDIPYVGCRSCVSAVGYDKVMAKQLFESLRISQVPWVVIDDDHENYKKIIQKLEFPMIIKPARSGSSLGISIANNKKELKQAISKAKEFDSKVIVEKRIEGQELEVAILESDQLIVSNVGEIKACHDIYDYDAKYTLSSITLIPANISKTVEQKIKEYAKKIFTEIGAKGMCRIDFFYDPLEDQIYLNEINTIPGFTDISMYPKLIMDQGYTLKEVIDLLIDSARFI